MPYSLPPGPSTGSRPQGVRVTGRLQELGSHNRNQMMTVNGPSIGLTDIETLPNTKESETHVRA
jgi:hypothetical protein